jgi:hypothetical protein
MSIFQMFLFLNFLAHFSPLLFIIFLHPSFSSSLVSSFCFIQNLLGDLIFILISSSYCSLVYLLRFLILIKSSASSYLYFLLVLLQLPLHYTHCMSRLYFLWENMSCENLQSSRWMMSYRFYRFIPLEWLIRKFCTAIWGTVCIPCILAIVIYLGIGIPCGQATNSTTLSFLWIISFPHM